MLIGILVFSAVAALFYFYIQNDDKKQKQQRNEQRMYQYVYQLKEHLALLYEINKNFNYLLEQMSFMDEKSLNEIRDSSIIKAASMASIVHLLMERSYGFEKNPFTNIALQKEDRELVKDHVESLGEGYIDLYDEDLETIRLFLRNT